MGEEKESIAFSNHLEEIKHLKMLIKQIKIDINKLLKKIEEFRKREKEARKIKLKKNIKLKQILETKKRLETVYNRLLKKQSDVKTLLSSISDGDNTTSIEEIRAQRKKMISDYKTVYSPSFFKRLGLFFTSKNKKDNVRSRTLNNKPTNIRSSVSMNPLGPVEESKESSPIGTNNTIGTNNYRYSIIRTSRPKTTSSKFISKPSENSRRTSKLTSKPTSSRPTPSSLTTSRPRSSRAPIPSQSRLTSRNRSHNSAINSSIKKNLREFQNSMSRK